MVPLQPVKSSMLTRADDEDVTAPSEVAEA